MRLAFSKLVEFIGQAAAYCRARLAEDERRPALPRGYDKKLADSTIKQDNLSAKLRERLGDK